MQGFWEWMAGDKGQLLVAGTAGAAVSSVMEWTGVLPAVRKIAVGATTAYFLSPLAVPFTGWLLDGISVPTENAAGMSGFLMGVLGIVVIETIYRAAQIRLKNLGSEPPAPPPVPPTGLPDVTACKQQEGPTGD